ncbi:creatininase family protein [Streptomyces coacervatus]|uniref:creatininase family protein n=1 Tax=Streptomyces coacervatus TaxID=647381 RepID=UPI0023DBFEC5|nr:creatininase family protein [Streptomyces coacervatus]MDF2269292.1 creatininase family protein [Streptomyces coacervatus]
MITKTTHARCLPHFESVIHGSGQASREIGKRFGLRCHGQHPPSGLEQARHFVRLHPRARQHVELVSDRHGDMHAGEIETSLLLDVAPELVRPGYESTDHNGGSRCLLLTLGTGFYTGSSVIGHPSCATAGKGKAISSGLEEGFADHLPALGENSYRQIRSGVGLTLDFVQGPECWVWRTTCAALVRWPATAVWA